MRLNRKEHLGKSGIYCIWNNVNNKVYIGKAKCIYTRMNDHITRLNTRNKDENPHLVNAWHKYGKDQFTYSVVEYCSIDKCSERELFWMKVYEALDKNKGYNIREDSSTGLIVSRETREKMRKSQIKRFEDPEERRKCSHNFFKDNPDKAKEMGRVVSKALLKYKIEQYAKSGELLKTWISILELMEAHPEYKRHNIYAVCSGEKPSMYGYIWRKVRL
jgi:group I intron endonuclease